MTSTKTLELVWRPDLHEELMHLNMGPQHPATHGVLRIILKLDGEEIVHAEPVIGYLHRGKEKMGEKLTWHQWIVHADRLDYLSPIINTTAYCEAVEKLAGIEIPPRAKFLRVILYELSRIFAHLVYVGTGALDIGAATVFFHAWREREKLYDIFDAITGLRMNNDFARIGGVPADIDDVAAAKIHTFLSDFEERVDGYEYLLSKNRLWWQRTRDVGVIDAESAVGLGLTGPNLRGSGVNRDLRIHEPYAAYDQFDFEVPVGTRGDCYDRYMVRIEELRQSARIIRQAFDKLPPGEIYAEDRRFVLPPKERVTTLHDKDEFHPRQASMEEIIAQFKLITDIKIPAGQTYAAVEASKGELGYYLVSDGTSRAKRLRVRSPSFNNLQALPRMAEGRLISDLIAVIASLDFVMGEVDR
jgi:NADH-quinone oxidoreductase subunit D